MLALSPNNHSLENLEQLLKAAGDGLRLAILQVLAKDSYGVLELAQMFNVRQSGMSHHLKVLAASGIVVTRREGNSIFYRRATITPDDSLSNIKQALFAHVDDLPISEEVGAALAQIWRERARASQHFFVENAPKFKEQQDLIASFDVYQQQIIELLEISEYPRMLNVLELGPGEGELLPELSRRFQHVVALDNSPQMLARANQRIAQHALINVQTILGDTRQLAEYPDYFDCAVINMVLHHAPSPSQIFRDIGATLKPRGVLVVTELCLHDQSWTQYACGDVWLGFAPEDLQQWAEQAGLNEGQSIYIALRNGFQIQIRQFIKRTP
jgi:ubiquinone/menaquinone biosynthesis C-methylase UbiE/DNA-binding transcriptional ArsR family regulator